MALGKAFIEVHADTKPFARELGRELNRIINETERDIRGSANRLGQTVSRETSRGIEQNKSSIRRSTKKVFDELGDDASIFSKFSKGIIDSIDDGLSGLPAEVKVALGAALLALTPFIAAGITAAVSAGLAGGFTILGVALASQFQVIQDDWARLVDFLRNTFVSSANSFVEPLLNAFDMVEDRLGTLQGYFREIFATSAGFVEPLTEGFLSFVENLLPGLQDSLINVMDVVEELAVGFGRLGRDIGIALRLITDSPYAAQALRDLLAVAGALIVNFALLVRVLTEVYGRLRDIALLATGNFQQFVLEQAVRAQAEAAENAASANGNYRDSILNLIAPTDEEAAALDNVNTIISDYVRNQFSASRANIGFEQSLADMSRELRDGSRTLEINTQAGRDNQTAILNAAEALIRQRDETIRLTGDTATANATFETNRKRLEDAAVAAGISRDRFKELTDRITKVPGPITTGVTPGTLSNLNTAISRFQTLGALIGSVIQQAARAAAAAAGVTGGPGGQGGGGSVPAYADGGIVSRPTLGLVGEAGPEAIIPLNNPQRAAEIMSQAGLGAMASPVVNVYIGNEQLDSYIDTRVDEGMNSSARSLTYGVRGI